MPSKRKQQRCYLYLRVSTEMQVEGYSLDAQHERLMREAVYREMQVVEVFQDAGKSGKNTTGRPAFQEMMQRIQDKADNVDYVLVYKLSRFGRNAADVLSNLQLMQDYGVNLICVEDGIDSSKDAGKLMISVLSAVAEVERENIHAQTMAGRVQKAREGRWNGGQAPYGYRIDKDSGTLVIEPEEAEIVKLIFNQYLCRSNGFARIAKWLNDNGYRRKPRGNGKFEQFSTTTIKHILDNPVYIGMIAYGRRRNEKKDGTRNEYHVVKQAEYDLYEGRHEAIIEQNVWNAVRHRRAETGVVRKKIHSMDHEHILSGILRCPVCGAPMYGSVNRKRRADGTYYPDQWYYVCKNRKSPSGQSCSFRRQPSQSEINTEVVAIVAYALRSPVFSEMMQGIMDERTDEGTVLKRLEALEKSRAQYAGAKDKLAECIDALDVTDPAYDAKYADMTQRLDKLYASLLDVDHDIASAHDDLSRLHENRATLEGAYEMLQFSADTLPTVTDAEKKEIVNAFVERVDIYPERQNDGRWVREIRFRFPVVIGDQVGEVWSRNENHDETVVCLSI